MNAKHHEIAPRERIIETACDLFYRQGYRATGINQVIKESGVAKASFYDHFPSKSDLLLEYVTEMSRRELGEIRSEIWELPTAEERFYAPLKTLAPWLESTNFRGCPFTIAMVEVEPDDDKVQAVVREHRSQEREILSQVAKEYLCDELGFTDVDFVELGETYLVIFEGAVATAAAMRDLWPVRKAIETIRLLATTMITQQEDEAE